MTASCTDIRGDLGCYVIGSLDPHERARVESHLALCPSCRDDLAELAPLPGLLARLTVDEAVTGPPPVDDAMLERLLRRVAAERRLAGRRRWLAAAAAVVLLVGGSVGGVGVWHATHTTHWQQVRAVAGPVGMKVDIQPASTGTAMQLWLWGVPHGERCRLIAVSDNGARDVAGSWEATYSGTAAIRGTTSITRAHLSQLRIETYDGTTLLSADVPPA